jgi:hypothetical protein
LAAQAGDEYSGFREARRLDGNRAPSPAPLANRIRGVKLYEVGLLGAEAVIMAVNAGVATGAFEQPRAAWTHPATWGPALGLAVGGLLLTTVVAQILAGALRGTEGGDLRRSKALLRAGLILLAVVILAVVFGNAAVRVGAIAPDPHLGALATTAGTVVLSVLAVAAAIAALTGLRVQRLRLEEQHAEVAAAFDLEQTTEAELSGAAHEADREVVAVERAAARLARLDAAFEADVATGEGILERHAHAASGRVARAIAVWQHLQELPAPVRAAVIRQSAARRSRPKYGALFGVGFALLVAVNGAACTSGAKPTSTVVLLDPTSPYPASRGDRALADAVFSAWSAADLTPGSQFEIVVSSGSISTTTLYDVATMPARFTGDPRGARRKWEDTARRKILTLQLPETPQGHDNGSNLTAALRVADRFAKSLNGHRTVLVVGSDGLNIDETSNFERAIPAPDAFVAAMEKKGGKPALAFDRVIVCGLRHEGLDAAAVERRDTIWRELLTVGGRAPEFLPEGCDAVSADRLAPIFETAGASIVTRAE